MQKTQIRLALVVVTLAIGLTMIAYAKDEKKDEVILTQLPDAVQKAVNDQTAGGKIDKIKQETEDGKLQYEVKFTKGDKKMEINVAPDGTVLATETEVALADVPSAVQKTIKGQAGDGTITKIVKATEAGKDHFGVLVTNKDKKKQWFEVATDGTLMPKEKDEADEQKEHGEHKD